MLFIILGAYGGSTGEERPPPPGYPGTPSSPRAAGLDRWHEQQMIQPPHPASGGELFLLC